MFHHSLFINLCGSKAQSKKKKEMTMKQRDSVVAEYCLVAQDLRLSDVKFMQICFVFYLVI